MNALTAGDLRESDVQRARDGAHRISKRFDIEARSAPYQAQVGVQDLQGRPQLHLEDLSAIPFLDDVPGVELYQHRARARAQAGDIFAAACPEVPGYEGYCEGLGLGKVAFVPAEPTEGPLAVAHACAHGEALQRLSAAARAADGLVIHPYMSNASVWALAAAISEASGVGTRVLGPPPPVLWLANDKAAFSKLVTEAVGAEFLVRTEIATQPQALAAHLLDFARRFSKVGLKRTRCASAMGNRVFDSQDILQAGGAGTLDLVHTFLEDTQWPEDEEVLVLEWLIDADSPSTQLWIPPLGQGDPVVDGVYEQILESERGVFVGSRPLLGPAVDPDYLRPSLLVAIALQSLGYVGRCSFDLLVNEVDGATSIRLSECNGRWGGTSTPMQLVDRLVKGPRPHYRAQDFIHAGLEGVAFTDVLQRLGDRLFNPQTQTGAYILYNVGPMFTSGKLDVIALGETAEHADELMLETLPRALGL